MFLYNVTKGKTHNEYKRQYRHDEYPVVNKFFEDMSRSIHPYIIHAYCFVCSTSVYQCSLSFRARIIISSISRTRPTFSCDDATPIIEGKNARFYALTGVLDKEWTTLKQGCSAFSKQVKEGVSYQLFVVQNCGDRKKGKK